MVNIRELASGSFQFFLWAKQDVLNTSVSGDDSSDYSSEEVYIDHKLIGECFIGMNKFFFTEPPAVSENILFIFLIIF